MNLNKTKTPDYSKAIKHTLGIGNKLFTLKVVHIKTLRYHLIKNYKLYYILDKDIKEVLTELGLVYKPACVAIYNTTMIFWTIPGLTPAEIREELLPYNNHVITIDINTEGVVA